MSLHIAAYKDDLVVLSTDSRISQYRFRQYSPDSEPVCVEAIADDNQEKIFMFQDRIGVTVSGIFDVEDTTVPAHMAAFFQENEKDSPDVETLSHRLLHSFDRYAEKPETCFHIAGMTQGKPVIFRVIVCRQTVEKFEVTRPGAIFNGSVGVLNRLLADRERFPVDFSTREGVVKFARDAIAITAREEPLQHGIRSVGGPIDMIAIDRDGAHWLQHKNHLL